MPVPPVRKVIVVGAGLAGLSAAHELCRAGFDVVILEAQTRAGGRVKTLRAAFADGLYADAGAMSFLDIHTNVLQYVQEFDLPVSIVPPPTGSEVVSVRGREILLNGTYERFHLNLTPEEKKLGLKGITDKYLNDPAKQIGDPSQPGWPFQDLSSLDAITAADFCRKNGASEGAIQLLSLSLVDFYGEGLVSCSALFVLVSLRLLQGSRNVFATEGGQDQLPRAIAKSMTEKIHYGCAVTRIERSATGATVYFNRTGRESSIAGDYVVCAIPFPILRTIQVNPPFSPEKAELVDQLPNTSVTRTYLQVSERFWEKGLMSGNAETDLPIMLVFPAFFRPSHRDILESYSAGDNARRLGALSDADRFAEVLSEMAELFPGIRQFTEGATDKVWDADKWALGAYAWYKPGQFLRFLPHLGTPDGRVFFAGDQTSLLPGWMEGALQSGIRAATQIQQAANPGTAAPT
ncbi:MAG: FAD-dependent oxidoreductase [Acidobacteriia bacterium]|nr:FAD-dependent oxidoreductase [Terriglobia bacterium]